MFRPLKLATAIAVAFSIVGPVGSADAHIGGRGGGFRIGGGLVPRARGNANGNRIGGNPGVATRPVPAPAPAVKAPAPVPAPKAPAASSIVQKGGTKSTSKPPVTSVTTKTNKPVPSNPAPSSVVSNSDTKSNPPKSDDEVQNAPANPPVKRNVIPAGHLVFSLTGNAAPEADANGTNAPADQPAGLPKETKKALEEALAADAPAAESLPPEVVSKEAAVPQIPVGATVTLNGKDLSDKEGQVVLQIGEIALPATITEWKNDRVTCTLPVLGLTRASKATLHVLKADGKTASQLNCELVTAVPTPGP